jgi:transposase InsO family protein
LASDVVPAGPNQLWVADITYIAIAVGFVYLAAILDAWSRRVVGYAIDRRVDARLALAALIITYGTCAMRRRWRLRLGGRRKRLRSAFRREQIDAD